MAPRLRTARFSVLLLAFATIAHAETGEDCLNGFDDDADGLIDCDDPGCGADAVVEPLDLRVDRTGPDGEFDLSWSGQGPGTVIDVASGELASLADGIAGCVFDSVLGGTELRGGGLGDAAPYAGSRWFLVRSQTPCANGAYGQESNGEQRVLTPGCRPGDALAGCDGGPIPRIVSAWAECDSFRYPDDVVVHLTNLTEAPVYWWYDACTSWPRIDRLVGLSVWYDISPCFACANGHTEWRELGPGEDLVVGVGIWGACTWGEGGYRARFRIADSCLVPDPERQRDCPDTRAVLTAPFLVGR